MMINRRLLPFLAAVLVLLAGCGGNAPEGAATPPAAAAPTVAEAPANIAAPVPEPAPASESNPVAGAEPVEESAATDGTAAPASDIVLPPSNPAPARQTEWKYREGQHYNVLTAAQGTSSPAGKIEVAEVFWFGCNHCYNLEPVLKDWVGKLPPDVNFVRIPVVWNPVNEIHARLYYTAEALGKADVIVPAVFRAIHLDGRPVTDEGEIQKLFAQHGVSADDFNRTFRSFSIDGQLKRAKDLTVKYRVKGVPLLVIDGKYTTDGPQIRSHADLLAVSEELIQRERQRS